MAPAIWGKWCKDICSLYTQRLQCIFCSDTLLNTEWWGCYIFPSQFLSTPSFSFFFSYLSLSSYRYSTPASKNLSKTFPVISCGVSFSRSSFSYLDFGRDLGKIIKRLLETEGYTVLFRRLGSRVIFLPAFSFSKNWSWNHYPLSASDQLNCGHHTLRHREFFFAALSVQAFLTACQIFCFP